jgi:hypothetical protein
VACSGSFREARGVRGLKRHIVFSFRHRSHVTCPVFLTHRSFCEWQRSQAERFLTVVLVSLAGDTDAEAEAEAACGSVKRSIFRTRVGMNRLKGRDGKIKKDIVQDHEVPLRYEVGMGVRLGRQDRRFPCTFGVPVVGLTNPPVARLTPHYPLQAIPL